MKLACTRCVILLALLAPSLLAAEQDLPQLQRCSELELRVAGLFRVGTASLHLVDCDQAQNQVLAQVPKQFSLDLARSFSGEDLSDAARDILTRNLDLDGSDSLPETLACLADAYVDADSGDRYDVVYRPQDSLSLYLNDDLVRECVDTGSGEKYFLIWFGDPPFHRRMRDELLRRAEANARS